MPYLGNRRSRELHDLERLRPQCQVDEIVAGGRDEPFDALADALRAGYEPCAYCIGTIADLPLVVAGSPLASAADLEAETLDGGRVRLGWTHPAAPGGDVRFDVYTSGDPLDPFAGRRGRDLDARSVVLEGLAGEVYLTVVARRGVVLALPSRVLRVLLPVPAAPVALSPSATAPAGEVGLAFPFAIDATGRVATQRGDPLLHARVLQLLLTAPGERVHRPDLGTRLRDLAFDPGDDVLAAATEFAVGRALRRHLGDEVVVDGVQVDSDEAELLVDVVYRRAADLRSERLRVGIPLAG